jgi:hypothetical protein
MANIGDQLRCREFAFSIARRKMDRDLEARFGAAARTRTYLGEFLGREEIRPQCGSHPVEESQETTPER